MNKNKNTVDTMAQRREADDLIKKARGIIDAAAREERDVTPEEDSTVDKMMADAEAMLARVERLEKLAGIEAELKESKGRDAKDGDEEGEEGDDGDEKDRSRSRGIWNRGEHRTATDILGSKEYRNAFSNYVRTGQVDYKYRDVVLGASGSDTGGGYLALPTQLSKQFIIALNNLTFYRDLVTIETVNEAKSLGVRQMTTQPSDAAWTSEIGSISADSTMAFGRRDLFPNLLSKLVNVSIRVMQAAPDAEKIVMDRLAYKTSIATENGFLNGSGSGQPLGVFTASSSGIPTSQDLVSSVALASNFTADDLINTLYNIPQQYQNSAKFGWIMHRSVVSYVRKLKDSYGQYLWQMGISANHPDLLLGKPVFQSEYAPSLNAGSPTASQYVAILGDYSYYTMAEVVPLQIQRLVELFATTSEVGFLARYWADGSPVLANAFTRLKLAAS